MATAAVLSSDTNLEALFGIEIDAGEQANAAPTAGIWSQIKCRKCAGTGKFFGWSGKAVGPCFACKGNGVHVAKDDGTAIDVTAIQTALTAAFDHGLRSPKLWLDTFCFSRAPDHGKNPGAIYVKDGEQYLGKILAGQFHPSRDCSDDQKAKIVAIASNPEAAAIAHGKRTGCCSCCHRTLTNAESIERGIGPICAEKYGW